MTTPLIPVSKGGFQSPLEKRNGPAPAPKKTPSYIASLPQLRDLPAISVGEFNDVQRVRRAMREMEDGHSFFLASGVVDAMGRDDRISGCMAQRIDGFFALPPLLDGGTESSAEALRENADAMFPGDQLSMLVHWGVMLGVGLAQLTWAQKDGLWQPTLRTWHPRFLRWDSNTRSFWVSTELGPQVEVNPGDGQWVLYTPYGQQYGWMQSRVRSLAIPWLIRQWAMRDWARHSEVLGIPVRKAVVPRTASAEEKKKFLNAVAALGTESCLMVEQGAEEEGDRFDLELVEAESGNGEAFDRLLTKMETNISISIVGQNLTTEVHGGSYAAANVHANVRADIISRDCRTLTRCLKEQVIAPWAELNFGSALGAPTYTWDAKPPEDTKASADTLNALGDGLTKLVAVGFKVDSAKAAERFGIPVLEGQESVELEPPAQEAAEGFDEADSESQAQGRTMSLSQAQAPAGAVQGQQYIDRLAGNAAEAGTKAIRPNLERILEVVQAAKSFEELKHSLLHTFQALTEHDLADVLEKATVLAELAGRFSALEDL